MQAETVIPVGTRAVSVPVVAKATGLCPATVWKLIASGELRSKKVGRRRLIPVEALDEFMATEGTR